MKRIITFGTFDLFHYGHLRILERAKKLGDYLIVGVSTDELNFKKKNEFPAYNQNHRLEIVRAIKYVDDVFFEESLNRKEHYLKHFKANVLVMGDDWQGKFDVHKNLCEVIYFSRTTGISSSKIKNSIKNTPTVLN